MTKIMLAMTSDFHGTSRNSADIKDALARIARAGFSHVHWCHEWSGYYLYSVHEMLQIKEWCDELGLKVKGVHATVGEKESDLKFYSSPNEYSRLAGVELIKNRVDLAHILNAEAIVLHFVLGVKKEEDFRQEHLLPVFKSFDELEPYCKTHKIRLCIENTGNTPAICCYVFDILCKRYDKDFLGLCFDTGHAFIHCKENCLVYAERYNDRLFMIHAHDNQGEKDEHIIPFEGGFDWEGFARVLARSPYALPILMEPSTKEEGDDTAWLEKAFEAGSRFSAMVEEHRNG
jgi:sugar phosphate isomerase/epimerase